MELPDSVAVLRDTVATSGGSLPVAVFDPRGTAVATYVVAMGYGAWLDEFELQRFRVLASVLRARLVVVETPGHGVARTRLTAREGRALLARSDLRPVSARMIDAAASVVGWDELRGARVLGYSLGASVAAAMACVLRERLGEPVPALVLVEPVAGQRWSPPALLRATRAEDSRVGGALADNDAVRGAVGPWDRDATRPGPRHDRLALLLYANALRAGRLGGDVLDSGVGSVVVVRGRDSLLSSAAAACDLSDLLRHEGRHVDELVTLGGHGLWHSLPTVHRLGCFVHRALDGAS